jgi:hypothetical protein
VALGLLALGLVAGGAALACRLVVGGRSIGGAIVTMRTGVAGGRGRGGDQQEERGQHEAGERTKAI